MEILAAKNNVIVVLASHYHCRHYSTHEPHDVLLFITFYPPKPQGSKRFQLISHFSMVSCGRNQANRLSSNTANKVNIQESVKWSNKVLAALLLPYSPIVTPLK